MTTQFDDDFAPVIGTVDASRYRRSDCVAPVLSADASDLDRHISRLLALHPDVSIAFRNQDLGQMDDQAKQALLDGINDVLGIRP
ncbi:MAG: hypothetical protein HQ518_08920 [Rhodopirellula sp.]|nr:hypothetical protein [Rhodopirellula sp.]